ncbi:hypothetical protein AJ80_01829 [Polytolypa hystricis UAMH7299]|uniref:Uncharacterized protein n=1 Tax=Polytolypa hystricis (strain UAMH7299) TaxID=1447883 RepID=A0A2B7YYW4_POLH7|nr:hypothetical protein AJ80_01829 [Polytolypa hystricis UAMH7299]
MIGKIDSQHIFDAPADTESKDSTAKCAIELAAQQVLPPRASQNFMAPVNKTTNKRCQEWTMEYVRRLVDLGYIDASAIAIVQSKRDPPNHGIGLQPAGRGKGAGSGRGQ